MKILNETQIFRKVKRLAIEIVEHNYNEKEIILAGINYNGIALAQMLLEEIARFSPIEITLTRISLSPAAPLSQDIHWEIPIAQMEGRTIIIVDDVANTGRTLFFAMKPILEILPKKVELAVLVDRKHKSFPIQPNYVGLSLATTFKENIDVFFKDTPEIYAQLT